MTREERIKIAECIKNISDNYNKLSTVLSISWFYDSEGTESYASALFADSPLDHGRKTAAALSDWAERAAQLAEKEGKDNEEA